MSEKNYRPYNSNVSLDKTSIKSVTPHPKAWSGDAQRWIVETFDGDSTVCVES